MKIYLLCILLSISLILTSCKQEEVGEDLNSKEDILILKDDNKSVQLSKKMDLLNDNENSSNNFTSVLSFIPNDEFLQTLTVFGDDISYLKLPHDKSYISGKLNYENNTEKNKIVQSIFFQGNKNILIKPSTTTKWVPAIVYDVPPHTSISINIDLKWDKNGMQELTFFPMEKNSDVYRYNGVNLSSYRFFVQSKDLTITEEMLHTQAFKLEEDGMTEDLNYFPEPQWTDGNGELLEYYIKDDVPLTNVETKGLIFDTIPYNTTLDLILIDEFGNSSVIKEKISVEKGKSTKVKFNNKDLKRMKDKSVRQFLLIMNNREEAILADIKAIELNQKPFPTSYQRVIEFYNDENSQ